MLARSGVRRAAGGMGLHRGRELLREIPRTFTACHHVGTREECDTNTWRVSHPSGDSYLLGVLQ